MSIKPNVITADEVAEQTQKLIKTKKEMELALDVLEGRLASIERSLAENDALRQSVQKLREESLSLFQQENKKRKELYPDTRLAILTKVGELLAPDKKN